MVATISCVPIMRTTNRVMRSSVRTELNTMFILISNYMIHIVFSSVGVSKLIGVVLEIAGLMMMIDELRE